MSDSWDSDQTGDDSYRQLLALEELESLQEELEERGADLSGGFAELPTDLRARLDSLGIGNESDLVSRIAAMHAELDEAEGSE